MPWGLSQWASWLVGFSEGGGGGANRFFFFLPPWLHPPKAYDFLFLVAQHLLGW